MAKCKGCKKECGDCFEFCPYCGKINYDRKSGGKSPTKTDFFAYVEGPNEIGKIRSRKHRLMLVAGILLLMIAASAYVIHVNSQDAVVEVTVTSVSAYDQISVRVFIDGKVAGNLEDIMPGKSAILKSHCKMGFMAVDDIVLVEAEVMSGHSASGSSFKSVKINHNSTSKVSFDL